MDERPYGPPDPDLEDRARTLLTAAAETVPVSSEPLPTRARGPMWPWLAAVAAVALLVVGLPVLLGGPGGDRPGPAPAPVGEVTVPQTLYQTSAAATETLETAGLEVKLAREYTCEIPPGRVAGSDPAPTMRVAGGSAVRLLVAEVPPNALCAGWDHLTEALGLLDLATSGGTGLRFAPEVEVYVGEEQTATLTGSEATDAAAWGDPSPLTMLVDALATEVHEVSGRLRMPKITAESVDAGDRGCGLAGDPPAALAARPSTVVAVRPVLPATVDYFSCHRFRLYRDAAGRIDAVTAPGDTRAPARPAEPTAEQKAVADAFAAYAGGGLAPAFAAEVRVLLGSRPVATVSAAQAADPGTWRLDCDRGYAERSCPIDALAPLRRGGPYAVTDTSVRESSTCHTVDGELPADLADPGARARSVSMSVPEPEMCLDNWELQLWYDEQDRIYAANLILGAP